MADKFEIVIPIEDLPNKFLEACQIIQKMRVMKKKWETEYGSLNKNNLKRIEEKADQFLKSLILKKEEE